jgi:cob(I)alamin adenosyltransferase
MDLKNIDTAELAAELKRREKSLDRLRKRRKKLTKELASIDAELAAWTGGKVAPGGGRTTRRRARNAISLGDALAGRTSASSASPADSTSGWPDEMVRLDRIYTKAGDSGETSLGDGTRVHKSHARIEAYGTVDELNAFVGQVLGTVQDATTRDRVHHIQNVLFDLGADLCVPFGRGGEDEAPRIRLDEATVTELEGWIDEINDGLPPLTSFVLPGGTPAASAMHVARTVCRRAERRVEALAAAEHINPVCGVYLNRLSDLLFVMARAAAGGDELLWKPTRPGEGS